MTPRPTPTTTTKYVTHMTCACLSQAGVLLIIAGVLQLIMGVVVIVQLIVALNVVSMQ